MNLHTLFMFGRPGAVILMVWGLTLIYFCVSGIWMYAKLWRTWLKRAPQVSVSGDRVAAPILSARTMRTVHRWLALPIALVLLVIAGSGVALVYRLWLSHNIPLKAAFFARAAPGEAAGAARPANRPEAPARAQQLEPEQSITPRSQSAGRINLSGGLQVEGRPPISKMPRAQMIQALLFFTHTGMIGGRAGEVLSILAGISLFVFSFTGAWMYLDMYRRRWRAGRKGLWWA
jgi:uncharacterized iron-regulated membrane protein